MTTNEFFINGIQKYTNFDNNNYMTIGSDTINATGTIINPKYLSAMVSNSVNPNNFNLVNSLSIASATTTPNYTINLQSAAAGVGSLWGLDYETTTAEDFQFTTSSASAGVNFNTVGNTTSTRIKNGTITSTSSTNITTIIPNQVEITDTSNILKKSTFGISQWLMRNGAFAFTQFDPTEINITNGNDTARFSTTTIGTNNSVSNLSSTIGAGIGLFTLSNIGTRLSNTGLNLGWNTGTSTGAITMTTTDVTNGTLTKTWTDILSASGATPTLLQVLTAGNTAQDKSIILTSTTNIRTTYDNTQINLLDTSDVQKYSRFAINQWNLKQSTSIYIQFTPTSLDMGTSGDSGRLTSTNVSFLNTASTRTGLLSNAQCYVATGGIGTQFDKDQINLGYNTSTFSKQLSISPTTITNTSPSLSKTWVSLLTIGTLLQSSLSSGVSITTTRLCQNSLNSGLAIPAGTYSVSYMVTFPSATTTYTTGFATPTAPITDNSTPSGTLYQYGGSIVNPAGTSASAVVCASSVIVFDGTKGLAIGIAVAPTMTITTAFLQAVRIA